MASVGTIPQLADYLLYGYWPYSGQAPHHWAISTVTVNISGLSGGEQTLAIASLDAWHEVSGVSFSYTNGPAQITYTHGGNKQALTNASWNGAGQMTSATVTISSNWSPGTDINSYMFQTYMHET